MLRSRRRRRKGDGCLRCCVIFFESSVDFSYQTEVEIKRGGDGGRGRLLMEAYSVVTAERDGDGG